MTERSGVASCALRLRYASEADVPILARLNQQLVLDGLSPNPRSPAELEQRMRDWLAGEYRAVIFEASGEAVAYAVFRPSVEGLYVQQFFVARAHRRRGVGRRAIELLREQVLPPGATLSLDVLLQNERGLEFWEAIGFRRGKTRAYGGHRHGVPFRL